MADLNDMPELDDVQTGVGDKVAVDIKGDGIDLNELRSGNAADFEIDPSSLEGGESENRYFDHEELFKQLNYDCLDDGCDSSDEKSAPFEKIRRDMTDISGGDGGVLKKIIKHGAGCIVPSKSLCRVHYNGYFEYSDEPFDSSRLRGRQHQFKLGSGESIVGFELSISTMKRGEISRFMVSSSYGYGKMGVPPRIPSDATILFEIELISFVDQGASDEFENFSEEERREASFDQILRVVETLRATGNEAFKLNQIGRAGGKYSQAIRLLENANLKDEDAEVIMKKSALKLYLNLSLCDLKQAKSARACTYARKALAIDNRNVKALFRLSRALRQLGDYEEARRNISKAHRLDSSNADIMDELRKLDEEITRSRKVDQALSRKMLNLNPVKKPTKKEIDEKPVSQVLSVFIERLKTFKDEASSTELMLPCVLTDEELVSLENIAKDMGFSTSSVMQGAKRSVRVSKTKDEVPCR